MYLKGLELLQRVEAVNINEGDIITARSNYYGFDFIIHYEYRKVSDDFFDFIDLNDNDNTLEASDLIYCDFEIANREDFEREWRMDI